MASYELPSGVLIVFLYDEPFGDLSSDVVIQQHLEVLGSFVSYYNANGRDTAGKSPSGAAAHAYPAAALVVSSLHHRSNHSAREQQHITAYVCSRIGWNLEPKRSNACVHIYSWNEQIDQGFSGYWIKNSNSNTFKSPIVGEKLQRALDNQRELPL
ncbi:hypothetical protein FN846DRAFT_917658 [Sphaerosporella brunnea]|uniref:Uncharacterized protein n=1 Tax=Sphaerosporella brunnea TaxID=1250544 RepID=A0A5J5F2W3_9PEZI|nr:hypothetical protein FN846DRAFT_917658 [Sphaerosporella brunnea]